MLPDGSGKVAQQNRWELKGFERVKGRSRVRWDSEPKQARKKEEEHDHEQT